MSTSETSDYWGKQLVSVLSPISRRILNCHNACSQTSCAILCIRPTCRLHTSTAHTRYRCAPGTSGAKAHVRTHTGSFHSRCCVHLHLINPLRMNVYMYALATLRRRPSPDKASARSCSATVCTSCMTSLTASSSTGWCPVSMRSLGSSASACTC